jgi:hypothetical protein
MINESSSTKFHTSFTWAVLYSSRFSPGTAAISSTNKTYRHNITEKVLKVELSTITLTLTLTFNNTPNHDQQNLSNSLNTKKGGGTTICEVGNIGIK